MTRSQKYQKRTGQLERCNHQRIMIWYVYLQPWYPSIQTYLTYPSV